MPFQAGQPLWARLPVGKEKQKVLRPVHFVDYTNDVSICIVRYTTESIETGLRTSQEYYVHFKDIQEYAGV